MFSKWCYFIVTPLDIFGDIKLNIFLKMAHNNILQNQMKQAYIYK